MAPAAPVTFRQTLALLRFYRREAGLRPLFHSVADGSWTARQTYYAVHGRRPDTLAAVLNEGGNSAYDVFLAALTSDELRKQHPAHILRAYPERARLFFVSIPRSAGAHFRTHLTSRFATVDARLCARDAADDAAFLDYLKHFALEIDHSDTIFVTGSGRLPLYEGWGVLRHDDRIVTILREPVSQAISQINHVIARILSSSQDTAEARNWRQMLAIGEIAAHRSQEDVLKLARRLLHDTGIIAANVACAALGGGSYDKAIERIAVHDIEVVDLARYDDWLHETWNIPPGGRAAPPEHGGGSVAHLSREDFSAADIDRIRTLTDQDRRLHGDLIRAREASGKPSARGAELVRPAPVPARRPAAPAPAAAPAPQAEAPQAPAQPVRAEPPAPPPAPPAVAEHAADPAASPDPPEPAPSPPASAALPLAPGELMKGFESIGENCEFGLVQRRCGIEPLGLLRFASAPLPKLMHALRERFAGLGQPGNIEVQLSDNGREYMILDRAFGLLYHAWVLAGEKTPEEIHAREVRRVPFLVRKLTEDLASGEKIMVFHGMTPLSRDEALGLAAAVRSYGQAVLLWMELADADHGPGAVERIAPGLLKGYMDRFAPGEDAQDVSLDCWIEVCRKARALSA